MIKRSFVTPAVILSFKIHPGLHKGTVQLVLVSEAVLPVVVLHVTPPDLHPNLTAVEIHRPTYTFSCDELLSLDALDRVVQKFHGQ